MHLLLEPRAWVIVVAFSVLGSIANLALYQVGSQGVDASFATGFGAGIAVGR